MEDADIDYSDIPPLDKTWFERARLRSPQAQQKVTVTVDAEALAWFQAQGEDWQKHMQAALRLYAAAHQ